MFKWEEGKPADGTYYYLQTKSGGASVLLLEDGTWRWEGHFTDELIELFIDMDAWWGRCLDKECAQQCAEEFLKEHGVY